MNSYQKKKYVCKLLYIYLLGFDIDFGHVEAVNLLSGSKYSEKQIGYLAVTLLFTENSDLARLVINSMRKDLEDRLEINNCLALQAIANLGGREIAESLAGDVFKLLVSGTAVNFVKKKAALCLLRLYRKHPDVVPVAEWSDKIIEIMDDYDVGVNLCACSLITYIAQNHMDQMRPCVPKAVQKLSKIVLEKEFTPDNLYYSVPAPWLLVKLCRLLQLFPLEESNIKDKLSAVLKRIYQSTNEIPKSANQNNATNAVVIEAINLTLHLDPDSELVVEAVNLLSRYIAAKETNMRYLGLDVMASLAYYPQCVESIKKNQETIISALKDKDVSVRRRALDLLYAICDLSNSKTIVSELLQLVPVADISMKEVLILKIAILTEKFAQESTWYVDMSLRLIDLAGDYVSNEVWYRVIQIVTNNPTLHAYTAKQALNLVRNPTCNEFVVKIAGYVLGEFGDLIANDPQSSPSDQFNALHSKFGTCSASTKSILLTAYIKFVNLFPEIKQECIAVFTQYRNVLDAELQQRATEYLALAMMPSEDLIQAIFEQMPPFPIRESALLKRLKASEEDRSGANSPERMDSPPKPLISSPPTVSTTKQIKESKAAVDDLLGLQELSVSSSAKESGVSTEQIASWFSNLSVKSSGVLYEDPAVQIGIKMEFKETTGKVALYFGNKTSAPISSMSIVAQPSRELQVVVVDGVNSIAPMTQVMQPILVNAVSVFVEAPVLDITLGQRKLPSIKLPISNIRFCSPIPMSSNDFLTRWKQIGGAPKEIQEVFSVSKKTPVEKIKSTLGELGIGSLEGIDPNPKNTVSACIFHTQTTGKAGCLIRLECDQERMLYRLTIRATNETILPLFFDSLKTTIVLI